MRYFDQMTIQQTLNEIVRADPESEASFEFREGEWAGFRLVASGPEIAQREVSEAARKAGVTDPAALGGAEAEP